MPRSRPNRIHPGSAGASLRCDLCAGASLRAFLSLVAGERYGEIHGDFTDSLKNTAHCAQGH
eukprot:1552658-Prymnesium_polylepis.1